MRPVQFPSILGAVSESESCDDSLPFIKGHSLLQLPEQFYLRRMLIMDGVSSQLGKHIFPMRLYVGWLKPGS